MSLHFASAVALLLLVHAGSPVVRRHDSTDEATRALADRFPATVGFGSMGSGTLIASRWVLTAGHVGRGLSPFSPVATVGGHEVRVRQVIPHPDSASDGRRPPPVDLALVELARAVTDVAPVGLYRGSDEAGQVAFIAGYGDHGPSRQRLAPSDGACRAVTNIVDSAREGRLFIDFDAPPEGTELEGVGGPGDSGGPLYLETDAGVLVAGVSSGAMGGAPGSYGVTDVYVRVSELVAWIEGTIATAADAPPRRPVVHELPDGLPAGVRGELLAAFLEVFELGEEDAFLLFAEDFRSQRSRRRGADAVFARRMTSLRAELGALRAVRVATGDPARWVVLVESERGGWRALHLRFEEEAGAVRLADLVLRPEPAPGVR
jgi:hypothetical protein